MEELVVWRRQTRPGDLPRDLWHARWRQWWGVGLSAAAGRSATAAEVSYVVVVVVVVVVAQALAAGDYPSAEPAERVWPVVSPAARH